MENRALLVDYTVKKCLYKESETKDLPDGMIPKDAVIVEGIMNKFAFHPGRLQENKQTINNLISGLPKQFYPATGGGWSFLNLCNDADGNQWADLHETMEALVCLAMAVGLAKWVLPRNMWSIMPGGMPYVVLTPEVTDGQQEAAKSN